jgi:hypothetical protein
VTDTEQLAITIPNLFQLNAGTISEGRDRFIILPPAIPMFDQLITHLDRASLRDGDLQTKHLGVGLAALCVRWGSYLATLMDLASEPHPAAASASSTQPNHFSMITDAEMMRMNIEVSYNIARLAQISRERGSSGFYDLLSKAHQLLPMPQKSVPRNRETTHFIAGLLLAGNMALGGMHLEDISSFIGDDEGTAELAATLARRPVKDIPLEYADRSLANTLACHAWRNTDIETIHAGHMPEPLLTPYQQRLTSREQRSLLREIAANFGAIYFLWDTLFDEDFRDNLLPTWPESAKAMANSFYGTWASSNWSLVDASSAVTLYK